MKYLIKNTYQYESRVWIEAKSEEEAKSKSCGHANEEVDADSCWHDSEVIDKKD